jgi:hypothetical protein
MSLDRLHFLVDYIYFSGGCIILLFLGHIKVSQNTFLGLFWPTGSYVAHGMRMTVASIFFVLIATPPPNATFPAI